MSRPDCYLLIGAMNRYSHFELKNPDSANSLDLEVANELLAAVKAAVKRKDIGLIVFSNHPTLFCSGGNLKKYAQQKSKSQGVVLNRKIRKIFDSIVASPLFLVAAVEGKVLGGGCEFLSIFDFVIGSNSSTYSFRQGRLNLTTGWGGARRLLQKVGRNHLLEWLLTTREISAAEAFEKKLIDQRCDGGSALSTGEGLLNSIPLNSDLISKFKLAMRDGGIKESKVFESLWYGDDHRRHLEKWK